MKGRRKQITPTTGQPTSNIPATPPEWLGDHAQAVWRQTVATLEAERRPLSMVNLQAFTCFCDAAGLVRECAEILAHEGMTIDGGREGKKRHPAVTTRISALNALRGYAIELALTPGSAGRLPANQNSEDFIASDEIRRNDPEGYQEYLTKHGRPPTNPFDMI